MSKLLVFLAFCCILMCQVLTQEASGRQFCDRLFANCLREQPTVGTRDDTVDLFNSYCGRNNRNWRKLTRCELVKASCIVTMVRCENGSCKNVADSLRS
uniref:Ecdysone-induced gene 71Eg n=2 Tax=Drosophila melanogaster TaxID=7227 RepID=Q9VUT0_DROME|nr:Ecdysone-induced gene 71Eg [Drosophila melanogaster]AAF49594.1 Ecdysone-induced gene 71Eg [Drosophila melanogaster]|eukprot:NP_524094.2 Ecdysone-induced gene 71Eg [Drosophila melanogaster]